MLDPDLKIRGRGGGVGGIDPVIKKVFLVLRASVWSKNKGETTASTHATIPNIVGPTT